VSPALSRTLRKLVGGCSVSHTALLFVVGSPKNGPPFRILPTLWETSVVLPALFIGPSISVIAPLATHGRTSHGTSLGVVSATSLAVLKLRNAECWPLRSWGSSTSCSMARASIASNREPKFPQRNSRSTTSPVWPHPSHRHVPAGWM
jgi:hypothetical protein